VWSPIEGKSYEQILETAYFRLDSERKAGDRTGIAKLMEHQEWDQHVTTSRRVGDPCVRCGDPWPCGPIVHILSPN